MNEPFDLRTFQLRLLDILTEVDKACQTHHIRYYLVAGTLLGAVRHKGFIPWDDDIDIAMPRPDYERFLRHAHEWLPAPLEVVAPEYTKHYPFAFAKVQDSHTTLLERRKLQYIGGLCIDIFPLDGLPSGQLKQWWNYLRKAALFCLPRPLQTRLRIAGIPFAALPEMPRPRQTATGYQTGSLPLRLQRMRLFNRQ